MQIKKAEEKSMQIRQAKEQSIKVKQQSIKSAGVIGMRVAADQVDGGDEMQDAAITAYVMSRPIAGATKQGAKFARDSAKKVHDRRIKRKEQKVELDMEPEEDGKEKRFGGKKKSSDKSDSDKRDSKRRKKGIRGLIQKLQMAAFIKQGKNEDGERKSSRWQMLLMQKIVIPALGFLALGMMLVALIAIPVMLVIALIYNSPFAIFFPPLESGDTVQSVTSAYVAEFNREVCNPITKEFREELYSLILQAYENVKNKTGEKQVKKTDGDKEGQDIIGLEFSVSVTMLEREDSDIKGIARIFIEDCFVINNVSIIQGKEDLFVAMPSYKTKKVDVNNRSVYRDVCYPVMKDFRESLYKEILNKYQKALEKREDTKILIAGNEKLEGTRNR